MKILVDADACPVAAKEILYKAAVRCALSLILVANTPLRIPRIPGVHGVVVKAGADEADDHIVSEVQAGDLVISADIPLAARAVKKGAIVLDPRGILLTEENIGPRIALRDLMDSLREEGMNTGGPAAYSLRDRQAFAAGLDRILSKALRRKP